jgi:DNA-binding MarR family transcriptional regulator
MPTVATPPNAALELANDLRPVLFQIHRHLRRELHSLGVTGGQVSLLGAIHGQPGIGVAELAQREGTSAPSISGHVDRLEAAGLVARTRDTGDRRRIGLNLTAEGNRVVRAVRSRRTAWLASRLAQLDAGDRAAVAAAIEPLQRLLRVTP